MRESLCAESADAEKGRERWRERERVSETVGERDGEGARKMEGERVTWQK